jgi:hypothetical protein
MRHAFLTGLRTMGIRSLSDLLWFHNWWRYSAGGDPWFSQPYHYFNLFEGTCWTVLSGLVLRRWLLNRHSSLEVYYAAAFLSFGLTDFREAYALDSWLIWVKLTNLIVLLLLRWIVRKRYYPSGTLY